MTGQQVMARLRERDGDGEILSLVKRIADTWNVTMNELLGDSRELCPSAARQQLWYELYLTGRWSYPRIARTFGRKAHETIIFGVKAHCKRNGFTPPRLGRGRRYEDPGEAMLPAKEA